MTELAAALAVLRASLAECEWSSFYDALKFSLCFLRESEAFSNSFKL